MEYTIQQLAKLAGVTSRTLRYYDEINLLKPARINSSGYRIYGEQEVDRLQQILFYRELDVPLIQIKEIINNPTFDALKALKNHREKLLVKRNQLDLLISNVNETIKSKEGEINMSDQDKFIGFKKKLIEENEQKYGKEVREKYGDKAVDKSNAKLMGLSEEDFKNVTNIESEMKELLKVAFQNGESPSSEKAQKAAQLHREWLCYFWPEYSKEAHANLAQMYVDDERFAAYYDQISPGITPFLRDAIHIYTGYEQNGENS